MASATWRCPVAERGVSARRGPSVTLAVAGVLVLLVGLGSLTGLGARLVDASVDGRWVLVVLAGVVGLALVVLPGRRRSGPAPVEP